MSGQRELEESVERLRFEADRQMREIERKKRRIQAVGKWVADNIVAIGALIVSIIALVRTFQ